MSERLPGLTHLQFLVLGELVDEERQGRFLREVLARHGVRRSGPAFYQMMARLEDQGFVRGAYDQRVVSGQLIKERRYAMTASGARELARARAFYEARLLRLESTRLRRV